MIWYSLGFGRGATAAAAPPIAPTAAHPRGFRPCFAALFLFAALPAAFCLEDYRARVAVIPMRNATGEVRYDAVCETVSETVALSLRLLGKYRIVEPEENPTLLTIDTTSPDALARLAEDSRYDEVLSGEAARIGDGPLTFRLSVFDRAEGKVTHEASSEAASILDVFDAAEELTIGLLSKLNDIHIGFGSMEIKEPAEKGKYAVFLNGNRIRNPKTGLRKVLNGTHALTIHQDRLLGDTVIFDRSVEIFEDMRTTVSFSIPAATPQEIAVLKEKKRKVEEAADSKNIDGLLREIAAFQEFSRKADYDATLRALQADTLAEAGAKATAMLRQSLEEADAFFYGKNPDFKVARERYQLLSRLVNNVFDYQTVDLGEQSPLESPREVRLAADRSLFILDGGVTPNLRYSENGKKLNRTISLEEAGAGTGRIATDASANVYFLAPAGDSILVFNRELEKLKDIGVPGVTPGEQESSALAVSDEGFLFLVIGDQVVVFEPGRDRDKEVENAISAGLKKSGVTRVADIFFDRDGLLNVFCSIERRLLRFDAIGAMQSEVAFSPCEADSSVAVDGLGYFSLTLPSEHRIVKFSPRGEPIASFGRYGVSPGEFSEPHGITASADGSLSVADTYNNRIQVLTLTSPPVLLPEVSQFGMRFASREETARKAQQRLDAIRENAKWGNIVWTLVGAAGFASGWATMHVVSASWQMQAVQADQQAAMETDPQHKMDLQNDASGLWETFHLMNFGAVLFDCLSAGYLTWSILAAFDNAGAEREAVSQIQALSMDDAYDFDRASYKSLKISESIGFWSGVVPPIAAFLTGIGTTLFNVPMTPLSVALIMGTSVGIPPIWSHLYSGELHAGLLVSSLLSDALVAAGAILLFNGNPSVPSSSDPGLGNAMLNDAWKTLPGWTGPYLIAAGVGIRLAAGIYDMQNGWIAAKNHNLYRAVKKKTPEVSMQVLPGHRWGEMGIAFALRY